MGIDVLEMFLLVEQHYGIELEAGDLDSIAKSRRPFDITAGELFAVIQAKGGSRLPRCAACGYNLTGHGNVGTCPECGTPFDDWEVLRTILAQVTGVRRSRISRDTFLLKDLKLT